MVARIKLSNTAVNAAANAVCALLNSGYLKLYTGTQPTTADTAIGAQVLLVTLRFNATAFAAASVGEAIANAFTDGTAIADGTATWCRAFKSDETTVIFDTSVGTGFLTQNYALDSNVIVAGNVISVTKFIYVSPKSFWG